MALGTRVFSGISGLFDDDEESLPQPSPFATGISGLMTGAGAGLSGLVSGVGKRAGQEPRSRLDRAYRQDLRDLNLLLRHDQVEPLQAHELLSTARSGLQERRAVTKAAPLQAIGTISELAGQAGTAPAALSGLLKMVPGLKPRQERQAFRGLSQMAGPAPWGQADSLALAADVEALKEQGITDPDEMFNQILTTQAQNALAADDPDAATAEFEASIPYLQQTFNQLMGVEAGGVGATAETGTESGEQSYWDRISKGGAGLFAGAHAFAPGTSKVGALTRAGWGRNALALSRMGGFGQGITNAAQQGISGLGSRMVQPPAANIFNARGGPFWGAEGGAASTGVLRMLGGAAAAIPLGIEATKLWRDRMADVQFQQGQEQASLQQSYFLLNQLADNVAQGIVDPQRYLTTLQNLTDYGNQEFSEDELDQLYQFGLAKFQEAAPRGAWPSALGQ